MAPSDSEVARLVSCCLTGPKHEGDDARCQDACRFCQLGDGRVVIALGDGLGSADLSHEGSALATTTALAVLREHCESQPPLDRDGAKVAFERAFRTARAVLKSEAERRDRAVSDFHTTLHTVIAGPSGVAGAGVGDGGAVYGCRDEFACLYPQERAIIDTGVANKTIPLTASNWEQSYRFAFGEAFDAVAVLSDGLEEWAWDGLDPNPELYRQTLALVTDADDTASAETRLHNALDTDQFRESTDDKTLVLASWDSPVGRASIESATDEDTVSTSPSSDAAASALSSERYDTAQRVIDDHPTEGASSATTDADTNGGEPSPAASASTGTAGSNDAAADTSPTADTTTPGPEDGDRSGAADSVEADPDDADAPGSSGTATHDRGSYNTAASAVPTDETSATEASGDASAADEHEPDASAGSSDTESVLTELDWDDRTTRPRDTGTDGSMTDTPVETDNAAEPSERESRADPGSSTDGSASDTESKPPTTEKDDATSHQKRQEVKIVDFTEAENLVKLTLAPPGRDPVAVTLWKGSVIRPGKNLQRFTDALSVGSDSLEELVGRTVPCEMMRENGLELTIDWQRLLGSDPDGVGDPSAGGADTDS